MSFLVAIFCSLSMTLQDANFEIGSLISVETMGSLNGRSQVTVLNS